MHESKKNEAVSPPFLALVVHACLHDRLLRAALWGPQPGRAIQCSTHIVKNEQMLDNPCGINQYNASQSCPHTS